MEQDIWIGTYPQPRLPAEHHAPTRMLHHSLLQVIGMLFASFALISLGAMQLATYTSPLPNPFAAYLDIFPGQPMSALEGRGFSCQFAQNHNYYATPSEGHCLLTTTADLFTSIEVVGSAQQIRVIKFMLNANIFQLGDLLVLFNVPHFQSYSQTTFAFWRDYFVELPTNGHIGFNPIDSYLWSVTFTLTAQ